MSPPGTNASAQLDDPELFMAMDDLELVAHGIVEGALHGLHRSPYLGFSAEFDAHREYQPGDELRHVNWNLWARTDRLYVKQFKIDTNLDLHILIDCSGSMRCEHGPTSKWRYAARAAAALAYVALRGRDAAGLFLLGSGVQEHVPPNVRRGQLAQITTLLQRADVEGEGRLARALQEVLHLCRRRGIVVLISDLLDDDAGILRGLDDLHHGGHEVVVLQVLDPWEKELPERGQFEFHDLETGERLRTDVTTIRASVLGDVRAWQQSLRRHCEQAGIDWLEATTATPLTELLVDYLWRRAEKT